MTRKPSRSARSSQRALWIQTWSSACRSIGVSSRTILASSAISGLLVRGVGDRHAASTSIPYTTRVGSDLISDRLDQRIVELEAEMAQGHAQPKQATGEQCRGGAAA